MTLPKNLRGLVHQLPRADCPVCLRWVPVRVNGELGKHYMRGSLNPFNKICPGSGARP